MHKVRLSYRLPFDALIHVCMICPVLFPGLRVEPRASCVLGGFSNLQSALLSSQEWERELCQETQGGIRCERNGAESN